ncbi:MAG TPA: ABC transporter permease [Verrucomicrobiae bacterium]|nr:ABC transporter permease [Verrucomicrobiae bacterium]
MSRIFAIAQLTWKAAFRFRLFWVLTTLLLGSVVVLPLLIKHDGTARGFTQILLTYSLMTITALLGFATLWLACGTLARDIEDCQMQVVCVKPIARWEIWLGKWLGITFLNLVLLAVAAGGLYALLQFRARQLPPDQQRVLRNEIFVARAGIKERPPEIDNYVEQLFQERIKETPVPAEDQPQVRKNIREQVLAHLQIVGPGFQRFWNLDLGIRKNFLRDQPLFARLKFFAAQTNALGTYEGTLALGDPRNPAARVIPVSLAAETFHEFEVPANVFDEQGRVMIAFANGSSTALLFPLDEGMELLYREGGFALNFTRGAAMILFWLALLAALGLASASFLSFPVAAFFSFTLLVIVLGSGSISMAVDEGYAIRPSEDMTTGLRFLNFALMQFFKGVLGLVRLVETFAPIDALSTGRSITWMQLGRGFAQVVLLMGGLLAIGGIYMFTRRELATAQGTQ